MKHLKYFEGKTQCSYWLLPTDERFEDSLKKINCPEYIMKLRFLHNHELRDGFKYAFIGCETNSSHYSDWGWNTYKGELSDEYYEECKYKFKGLVNIEEHELVADKYNL